MQEKYKTHVSDIQPMKPNGLRTHSTVASIKWLMEKYEMSEYETIGCLLELIQEECDEMDSKIGNFEIRLK